MGCVIASIDIILFYFYILYTNLISPSTHPFI